MPPLEGRASPADGAAYVGEVGADGARLWFFDGTGVRQPVDHVVLNSRGGVAWGYSGNGPADAALSILTVETGDPVAAERLHKTFMRDVLAPLPLNERFALSRPDVQAWLERHGFERPAELVPRQPVTGSAAESGGQADDVADRQAADDRLIADRQAADRQAADRVREAAERQSAMLVARSRELDEREQRLALREARVDAMAVTVGLVAVVEQARSLPAEPVRRQLEALSVDSGEGVGDVARARGIDPEWAAAVAAGAITRVDLEHVRQVCEGLRCTPYDLWGPGPARSVAHAYGPEAWPAGAESLLPVDGLDPVAPSLSADWGPAALPGLGGHALEPAAAVVPGPVRDLGPELVP